MRRVGMFVALAWPPDAPTSGFQRPSPIVRKRRLTTLLTLDLPRRSMGRETVPGCKPWVREGGKSPLFVVRLQNSLIVYVSRLFTMLLSRLRPPLPQRRCFESTNILGDSLLSRAAECGKIDVFEVVLDCALGCLCHSQVRRLLETLASLPGAVPPVACAATTVDGTR